MSTTVEDAKKRVKDEIEADAAAKKQANDEAAQTQIDANNTAAQTRKDNFADQVKTANENLTNRANADKDDTYAKYDEIYDTNAVNQYISEERVAENMANLGLTNSGLNATQLTAIETSRGNADNRARLQEQKAIETIELELAANIAQNEQSMLNYNAEVDADLEERNAAILAGVQSQNAQVDADANAAINAAWKDIDDTATKTIQDAADTRAEEIKLITDAAKTLNIDKSDESGALGLIKRAADQYSLSTNEIATMCGSAGISYDTYAERFLYGGDGEVKWAQNHKEIANGLYSKTNSKNYAFIKDIWDSAKTDEERKYIIDDFVTAKVFTADEAEQIWLYLPTIEKETVAANPELTLSMLMDAAKLGRLDDAPLAFLLCMAGL